MIKKFGSAFVALCCALVSGCSSLHPTAYNLVDKPAPHANLTLFDGRQLPLDAFKGKHTALMFWATWCGYSRARMEDFAELAQKYSGRSDVAFIAVSVDKLESFQTLGARIDSGKLNHMLHVFSGNDVHDEAYVAFKGDVVPYIIVIDPRGTVRSVDVSTSQLEDYLEEVTESR